MRLPSFSLGELIEAAAERLQLRLPTDAVPATWRAIVDGNVPLARRLDDTGFERLMHITQLFLSEVPFEGCDGVEITDEIRVTIAATASLLLVRMQYPRFTKVLRVLVYPQAFVPVSAPSRHAGIEWEPRPAVGQAWRDGMVVLSWESVVNDAARPEGGGSVVLHEFAHMLDAEDGRMNGIPLLDDAARQAEWEPVLNETFAQARADHTALGAYATENEAELFAVGTETFFCLPAYLQPRLPAFYSQLSAYYGVDPRK